jgi:hypothetical protein
MSGEWFGAPASVDVYGARNRRTWRLLANRFLPLPVPCARSVGS